VVVDTCRDCMKTIRPRKKIDKKERIYVESKVCCRCKQEKLRNDFAILKQSVDGLRGHCTSCENEYTKNKRKELSSRKEINIPEERVCYTCKVIKSKSEFFSEKGHWSGLSKDCKICSKDRCVKYRKENKDKIKSHREKPEIKAREKETGKIYTKENRDIINEYTRNKRNTDIQFKIGGNIRSRILCALKNGVIDGKEPRKHASSIVLLGCSIKFFIKYLESKFLPTMTWENHGTLWEIDHIIPCTVHDLTNPDEQLKCFHYSNQQPLFKVTTIIDGVEYIGNRNKNANIVDYISRPTPPTTL